MEQQQNQSSPETSRRAASPEFTGAEGEIMAVMEGVAEAFRTRDLDKIMSYYAPDIVAFDMAPPLSYHGVDSYRKAWQMGMDMMSEAGPMETAEDRFYVSGDLGVYHGLCHMSGTLKKDKQKVDSWSRYTGVFKRMNGRWLIVHEQFSVPIDIETEKAIWDLKPEGRETLQ